MRLQPFGPGASRCERNRRQILRRRHGPCVAGSSVERLKKRDKHRTLGARGELARTDERHSRPERCREDLSTNEAHPVESSRAIRGPLLDHAVGARGAQSPDRLGARGRGVHYPLSALVERELGSGSASWHLLLEILAMPGLPVVERLPRAFHEPGYEREGGRAIGGELNQRLQ